MQPPAAMSMPPAARTIGSDEDVHAWLASPTCVELCAFAEAVGDAIRGVENDAALATSVGARLLVSALDRLAAEASAQPRSEAARAAARFGDPAYREWYDAMAARALEDMRTLAAEAEGPGSAAQAEAGGGGAAQPAHQPPARPPSEGPDALAAELRAYWVDSFGSRARLDYGTGHEATFCMLLLAAAKRGCLRTDGGAGGAGGGAPADAGAAGGGGGGGGVGDGVRPEYAWSTDRAALVAIGCAIFPAYARLVRALTSLFNLEPAGSHGVWCVDDYVMLPFAWGAAQLIGHAHVRTPKTVVVDVDGGAGGGGGGLVDMFAQRTHFLSAVAHAKATKARSCSLQEACPILCDICKMARDWPTAARGLVQLWRLEVLGKFPVAQHLLFGRTLPFRPPPQPPRSQPQPQPSAPALGGGACAAMPPTAFPGAMPMGGMAPPQHTSIVELVGRLFGGGTPASAAPQHTGSAAARARARAAAAAAAGGGGAPAAPVLAGAAAPVAAVAPAVPAAIAPSAQPVPAHPLAGPGAWELDPGDSGIRMHGWHVHAARAPLANAAQLRALGAALGERAQLPEMVFPDAHLTLEFEPPAPTTPPGDAAARPLGLRIRLCALDALRGAVLAPDGSRPHADGRAPDPSPLKLPAAGAWSERLSRLAADIEHLEVDASPVEASDWTFSTTYRGSYSYAYACGEGAGSGGGADGGGADGGGGGGLSRARPQPAAPGEGIDYELLRRREPILWNEEVHLFESELDDNGVAQLSARVRVMPSCWFVLLRFWLRVDGLLVRLHDTRLFHRFGARAVLLEYTAREDTFEALRARGLPAEATAYLDPNPVAETLSVTARFVEQLPVSGRAAELPLATGGGAD